MNQLYESISLKKMETSDSEYFESADEDFCSDDETPIEKNENEKQTSSGKIVEKTEKLSVSDSVTCKSSNENEAKIKDIETKVEAKENVTKENNGRKIEKDDKVTENLEDSIKRTVSYKTECWEPGVDYEYNDSPSEPQYVSKQQTKRLEFGIPPARVGGCCFPRNTQSKINDNTDQSNNSSCIPQSQIPPAVSSSGHVSEHSKGSDLQDPNMKPDYTKKDQKRPEFGIPPAIPACWIPGVTDIRKIKPFEPHPAYLELMKKQNKDTEQNMWENEDWGDFDITTKQDDQLNKPNNDKLNSTEKKVKEVEENMWEDDDWEPIESNSQQNLENSSDNRQTKEEKSSWGAWGNWGLSSVLSTATILTNQVSQGITNVLETGIGAPDPEELARINKLEEKKTKEMASISNEDVPIDKPILGFGFGNLVQGVTKLVETTGTKVISGGLDTLETIGKKTMEVLQENDPGLKKKRAFLKLDDDKPILSQVLREAKEKAERENKELERKHSARKANYETLFDDHQGLVHLEALEMLSKQCDIKLQSLLESASGNALNEMQETLDQVKELCELPEEDEEETLTINEIKEILESAVSEINIKITYSRLLKTWEEIEGWLSKLNLKICSKNELHQQAIESLAQLTAIAVEQFHKAGELLLVKDHRSTADEADSLVQLTTTLTVVIGIVAARFSEKLNTLAADSGDKEEINSLITNVFYEAANSSSYIQDAFQLLIPVLQVGAV